MATIVVACPICQAKLRAPDSVLGKQVKCSQCKNYFTATDGTGGAAPPGPAPASPPPPGDPFAFDDPGGTGAWQETAVHETPSEEVAPRRRGSRGGAAPAAGGLKGYLLFHRMITPAIILVLFYGVTVLFLLGGLTTFGFGVYMLFQKGVGVYAALILFAEALIGTPLAILGWRIYCEVLITFFRILENVQAINERMEEQSKR
jgi:hypothetical protein